MRKILYLHGLESGQGGPKVDYLTSQTTCHAPEMDYTRKDLFSYLVNLVEEFEPDLIIGSSMGGYCAYILGGLYEIPVLAFNPALHSRTFDPPLPSFVKKHHPTKMTVVIGDKDAVIPGNKTLDYMKDYMVDNVANVIVERIKDMGHRVTLDVFCNMYNKTT